MFRLTTILGLGGLLFFALASLLAAESPICRDQSSVKFGDDNLIVMETPKPAGKGGQTYIGSLRVSVVQPVSTRWRDSQGRYFEHVFLDCPIHVPLSIPYQETYSVTETWDGKTVVYDETNDFGFLTADSIIVIAAVYDSIPYTAYSDPPSGAEFTAYYCNAAAEARPDIPGSNIVNENYTHTVLIEEGATTW